MFCPLTSTIQSLDFMFNFGSVGCSWFKRLILMCPGIRNGLRVRVDDVGLRAVELRGRVDDVGLRAVELMM